METRAIKEKNWGSESEPGAESPHPVDGRGKHTVAHKAGGKPLCGLCGFSTTSTTSSVEGLHPGGVQRTGARRTHL